MGAGETITEKIAAAKEKGTAIYKSLPPWIVPALGGAIKFIGKPGSPLSQIGKGKRKK
jgi:hypothetical protein